MDSYEQPPSSSQGNSSLMLIIGGVALICLCGGLAVGVVGVAGYVMYLRGSAVGQQPVAVEEAPAIGPAVITDEAIPVQPGVEEVPTEEPLHVSEDVEIEYSTNPPTSGYHYEGWGEAGLYDEPIEDGFLVHNLEHGYVIIWYDCEQSDDCDGLKEDIQGVIDWAESNDSEQGYKVIGMPRSGMETMLALTTWGRLARLTTFDEVFIQDFIDAYQGVAPEPFAP